MQTSGLCNMFRVLTVNPNCGTGWHENPRTGQCYKLGEESLCWSDAVSSCEAVGGTLLVPEDEEEQQFIKGLVIINTKACPVKYTFFYKYKIENVQLKMFDIFLIFPKID